LNAGVAPTSASSTPPLSVVIGTTEGWPYVEPLLKSLRPDAERLGVEIIFADGSGRPPPAQDEVGPQVRWLAYLEPSVFRLYWHGLHAARGAVVATTEDHCVARAGWCEAILAAHAEHPQAAAIGGAIENGSRETLLDWASYFITQGLHMAPLGQRAVRVTTNEACLSLKRDVVGRLTDSGGLGFMAILELRRLADSGAELRVDDRFAVDHFQTIGVGETTAIHFHNGRAIAGFRRRRGMTGEDWLRMLGALALPFVRTVRAVSLCWRKGRHRRVLLASAPLMLWLDLCQGFGHLLGYALGPGDSPGRMR
jgi:hypothetical protein